MARKARQQAGSNATAPQFVFPALNDRPVFGNYPLPVTHNAVDYAAGAYEHTIGESNGKKFPVDNWLCGSLEVTAKTANREDVEYGRLLEFTSSNGQTKKWAMPCALLAGDSIE